MIDYKPAAMLTYITVTELTQFLNIFSTLLCPLRHTNLLALYWIFNNLIHTKVAITVNFVSFRKYPISYFPVQPAQLVATEAGETLSMKTSCELWVLSKNYF